MPVERPASAVEEEGAVPYVPEEKRELESGASVEGIPLTEEDEDKAEPSASVEEDQAKEVNNEDGKPEDKSGETA